MPTIESAKLGTITYPDEHVLHFPLGLPAFEDETRFLAVERPGLSPVVFLQSIQRPDLAFATLPVKVLAPEFELTLTEDELGWLSATPVGSGLAASIADDLIALAMVTIGDKGITANLRAPVVVNQRTKVGLQAIQADSSYSLEHVIDPANRQGPGARPVESKEAQCS